MYTYYCDVNETNEALSDKLPTKALVMMASNSFTLPYDKQPKQVVKNLAAMLYHADNCRIEVMDMFDNVAFRLTKAGGNYVEIHNMATYELQYLGIKYGEFVMPITLSPSLHDIVKAYITAHFDNIS